MRYLKLIAAPAMSPATLSRADETGMMPWKELSTAPGMFDDLKHSARAVKAAFYDC